MRSKSQKQTTNPAKAMIRTMTATHIDHVMGAGSKHVRVNRTDTGLPSFPARTIRADKRKSPDDKTRLFSYARPAVQL